MVSEFRMVICLLRYLTHQSKKKIVYPKNLVPLLLQKDFP